MVAPLSNQGRKLPPKTRSTSTLLQRMRRVKSRSDCRQRVMRRHGRCSTASVFQIPPTPMAAMPQLLQTLGLHTLSPSKSICTGAICVRGNHCHCTLQSADKSECSATPLSPHRQSAAAVNSAKQRLQGESFRTWNEVSKNSVNPTEVKRTSSTVCFSSPTEPGGFLAGLCGLEDS